MTVTCLSRQPSRESSRTTSSGSGKRTTPTRARMSMRATQYRLSLNALAAVSVDDLGGSRTRRFVAPQSRKRPQARARTPTSDSSESSNEMARQTSRYSSAKTLVRSRSATLPAEESMTLGTTTCSNYSDRRSAMSLTSIHDECGLDRVPQVLDRGFWNIRCKLTSDGVFVRRHNQLGRRSRMSRRC